MSLKTWIKEFYPIPACEVSEEDALRHSLRKWEGLLEKNLEKHRGEIPFEYAAFILIDDEGIPTSFTSAGTCALCQHYGKYRCINCPLNEHSNNCNEENSAYRKCLNSKSAEPMVELLRKLVKLEEGE